MKHIKPGRYTATIIDHGITETQAGDPQASVKFSIEADGEQREITWYGSFKDKALPFTLEALVVMGLQGNNPAGALELGRQVSITIEDKTSQDGTIRSQVRWVNRLTKPMEKVDSLTARAKLEKYSGAIMAIKAKEASSSNGAKADSEELPF